MSWREGYIELLLDSILIWNRDIFVSGNAKAYSSLVMSLIDLHLCYSDSYIRVRNILLQASNLTILWNFSRFLTKLKCTSVLSMSECQRVWQVKWNVHTTQIVKCQWYMFLMVVINDYPRVKRYRSPWNLDIQGGCFLKLWTHHSSHWPIKPCISGSNWLMQPVSL